MDARKSELSFLRMRAGCSLVTFFRIALLMFTVGALFADRLSADDVRVLLESLQNPTNVFGGSEVEFHFATRGIDAGQGHLTWILSQPDGRPLIRGESAIEKEKDATVIRLVIPPVKDGVVLPLVLSVCVVDASGQRTAASCKQKLWVFCRQPFADQKQWLKDLKITLYDPIGKTATALTGLEIPYNETRNVAALSELTEGMILIGEGASFREDRDLPPTLWAVAARGTPVLCLAPSEGTFALSGAGASPAPKSLSFKRHEVIGALDDRLDVGIWRQDAANPKSGLALRAEAGEVLAEVAPDAGSWPWIEASFEKDKGRLILCSFGFLERWENSPTPRFLLARILSKLDGRHERTELQERTLVK